MWYRAVLTGLDTGMKPLLADQATEESANLADLAAKVGCQAAHMLTHLRGTDLAFLEGVGYLSIELQTWASLSSYEASGEVAGKWLRAMRAYATHSLYYGPGSRSQRTGTGLLDSFPN